MSTNSVWGGMDSVPVSDLHWATTTREPNPDLDRQAFLNLLITQLRHQDPLNPMDDRDFIAQMAQFSALEQMQNLNATFERTQAFNMIGRAIDASFAHTVTGEWMDIEGRVVTGVTNRGSSTYLTVLGPDGNFVDVPLQSVTYVGDVSTNQSMPSWHIGRFVQAITVNGDRAEFVEGQVTAVKMQGNQVILVVGTQEIFYPHEVHSVSDRMLLLGSEASLGRFTNAPNHYVRSVEIANDRAYLVFSNGERVHIDRINQATEALAFINQSISHGTTHGVVRNITILAGIPFLNVYGGVDGNVRQGQVNFIEFLLSRAGGGTGTQSDSTNNAPTTPPPATPPPTTPPNDTNGGS